MLLARCIPLNQTVEHLAWEKAPDVKASKVALQNLIADNRKPFEDGQKGVQPERYKYLPGTFFLEDSVVDFQDIVAVSIADVSVLARVACLDSPFAEALLGRFTRYFGRLGTPDVSKSAVFERLDLLRKRQSSSTGAMQIPSPT